MLEVKNLSVGYPGRTVLEDVSLAVRPGRVLVLLGPNGCGKSTLLRTLPGLLPPLGGEILLDGRSLGNYSPREAARKIAYLPQSRVDRPLPELSGGQRQKVYLALALAQETETILMDEPTTYLDIRNQLETLALLRRLAAEGRGAAAVLHDLCLALAAADDVAVLGEGRLLALGGPEEIYRSGILERVMGVRLDRTAGPGGWRYFCELPEEG